MDSKPKYTGDDYFYEIEEDFLKELEGLHPKYGSSIIKHLDGIVQEIAEDKLPETYMKTKQAWWQAW